jgi:hypothetical protein
MMKEAGRFFESQLFGCELNFVIRATDATQWSDRSKVTGKKNLDFVTVIIFLQS